VVGSTQQRDGQAQDWILILLGSRPRSVPDDRFTSRRSKIWGADHDLGSEAVVTLLCRMDQDISPDPYKEYESAKQLPLA
jgi:hypothetical protein